MTARGDDIDTLCDAGAPFSIKEADQGLTHGQLGNGSFYIDVRVGAHGLCGRLDGLLVPGCEGTQGMLHVVTQLGEHTVRNIHGVLRDKVDPHALGAYQPHHQFNALDQRFGCVIEEQVCFVKEKGELGFFGVSNFWQLLEKLREHPQQERGVQAWRLHELVGGQDVDDAPTLGVGLHQVIDIEHGLAKELVTPLRFNL